PDSHTLRKVRQILGDVEEGHPAPLAPSPYPFLLDLLDGFPCVLRLLSEEDGPEDVHRPGVDGEPAVGVDYVRGVVSDTRQFHEDLLRSLGRHGHDLMDI